MSQSEPYVEALPRAQEVSTDAFEKVRSSKHSNQPAVSSSISRRRCSLKYVLLKSRNLNLYTRTFPRSRLTNLSSYSLSGHLLMEGVSDIIDFYDSI